MMVQHVIARISKTIPNTRCITHALSKSHIKTAGIIVIGDEILHGEVIDTNSGFMTTRFYKMGIKVKKISVIGDCIDEISDEVKIFSNKYNYVITTGGIGPTHDDVTFEGIAKAFNEPIVVHPELVHLVKQFYKTNDDNCPGMKLARVPKSAKLTFTDVEIKRTKYNYPNISVKNVYIFPGIPQLCERAFTIFSPILFQSSNKFFTRYVYFNVTEDKLVDALNQIVKLYPTVSFGSYPTLYSSCYKVKVTIESTVEKDTTAAQQRLLEVMPKESVIDGVEKSHK